MGKTREKGNQAERFSNPIQKNRTGQHFAQNELPRKTRVIPTRPANMLGTGRNFMELANGLSVFPGAAIVLAVLGFNFAGDGLRDVLDPRLRGV